MNKLSKCFDQSKVKSPSFFNVTWQPLLTKFPRTECLLTNTLEAPCPDSMHEFLVMNNINDFQELNTLCALLCNKALIFSELRARNSDTYENLISAKLETKSNASILRIVNNSTTKVWFSKENTIVNQFHK